ncbi:hypothetical protein D9611_013531 [Ephemerocybe angulata]|uniref:Uncharacterized protein n=1 Tax=Ephemerocybe angulata TaxID=980116 RepID=A0A8H5C590_9AGAR|nr:hypothetical protein D9611_013531 [Tulosesus angulatus]
MVHKRRRGKKSDNPVVDHWEVPTFESAEPGPGGGAYRRVDASHFHGPQFITNLEGGVLEASEIATIGINCKRFTGGKNQQWLIQADPNGSGKVALASMNDGRYLKELGIGSTFVVPSRTPFYWELQQEGPGIYSLASPIGQRRLTLPSELGRCSARFPGEWAIEGTDPSWRLLILENTSKIMHDLRSGSIGPYAYPDQEVYHSVGDEGRVNVMNHLETAIYVAISGLTGNAAQWTIEPGKSQYWRRSKDEIAHVSIPGSIAGQSAQTYPARLGKILHVQKLPTELAWEDGPQFISNLEGAILDASESPTVTSSKFSGTRQQQWLIQADPSGSGRVALASLHDGSYLMAPGLDSSFIVTNGAPFYWDLNEIETGIYSVADRLIILENSKPVRDNLLLGIIGPYAYPEQSIYYSIGASGYITIMNHLKTHIHATVSCQTGKGSTGQWSIGPERTEYWSRRTDESAHISIQGVMGGQTAQAFLARTGKILHIQKVPSEEAWQGIKSVFPAEATYSVQSGIGKERYIGIKNDLTFDIYVSVFNSLVVGDTFQSTIKPGAVASWLRTAGPETVFVSVGSAPGVPRAYLGRPGFILHIDRTS